MVARGTEAAGSTKHDALSGSLQHTARYCGDWRRPISKCFNDALEKRHCLLSCLVKPLVVTGFSFGSAFALYVGIPIRDWGWNVAHAGAELVESPMLETSAIVNGQRPPRFELSDGLGVLVRTVGRLDESNRASMHSASLGDFVGAAEPIAEKGADYDADQITTI